MKVTCLQTELPVLTLSLKPILVPLSIRIKGTISVVKIFISGSTSSDILSEIMFYGDGSAEP